MSRDTSRVRWIGLVAILFSLLTPLINTDALAETEVPESGVVVTEGETPTAPEPTLEPTAEPTIPPTATMVPTDIPAPEPTATVAPTLEPVTGPTVPPTEEPTVEPTAEPTTEQTPTVEATLEPTPEPTSASRSIQSGPGMAPADATQLDITIVPDASSFQPGSPASITVTVNAGAVQLFGMELFPPTVDGMAWSATPTDGACDEDFYCWTDNPGSKTFTVRLSSPTTSASCGTHTIEAKAHGSQGSKSVTGTFTVRCASNVSMSVTGPDTIIPGDPLSYDITLTNSGAGPESVMFLRATLPLLSGGTWNMDKPAGVDCVVEGSLLDCSSLTIDVGQTVTVTLWTNDTGALSCDDQLMFTALSSITGSIQKATTVSCPRPEVGITQVPGAAIVEVGGTASFTITVANTGTGTSTPYGLQDLLPDMGAETAWTISASDFGGLCAITIEGDGQYLDCFVEPLEPNESRSITVQHAVTGKVCGELSNTAHLYNADETIHDSATATITIEGCRKELTLELEGPPILSPGSPIEYTVTVTNTGTVDVTDGSFRLDLPDTGENWTPVFPNICAVEDNTMTCTGLNIQGGGWFMEIRVTGNVGYLGESCAGLSAQATLTGGYEGTSNVFTTGVSCIAGLIGYKSLVAIDGIPADQFTGEVVLGTGLTYKIDVTNSGNIPVNTVVVTGLVDGVSFEDCEAATLARGNTLTCEATYAIQQADVDAGAFLNSVRVTGVGINGEDVEEEASAVEVVVTGYPSLTLDAEGIYVAPSGTTPYGSVSYTFRATNGGTTTLHGVKIYESSASYPLGLVLACTVGGQAVEQPVSLPVGGVLECTATYALTQQHIDDGVLDANPAADSSATDPSRVYLSTDIPQAPAITVETTPTNVPDSGFILADNAIVSITVTNPGNVTLESVRVSDDIDRMVVDCGDPDAWAPHVIPTFAPETSVTCVGTVEITQPDVDAGERVITTQVTADTPWRTDPPEVSASHEITVPTNGTPEIGLWMSAWPTPETLEVGQDIYWEFYAENTGTVTLTDVMIVAGDTGDSPDLFCEADDGEVSQPVTLAPGDALFCEAVSIVTQGDVDAGSITNSGSVSGLYQDETVTDTASLTIGDGATRLADVEITTTASPRNGVIAGTDVTYSYTIRNTGSVTLSDLIVTDDIVDGIHCGDGTNVIAELPPTGEPATCTATYTVSQEIIDTAGPAGESTWSITSTATVRAGTPSGMDPEHVSASSETTISGPRTVALLLATTASRADGSEIGPGATVEGGAEITFTFTVTNPGHLTISGVELDSSLGGLAWANAGANRTGIMAFAQVNPGGTIGELAPGASATLTATYTVTAADVEAGSIRIVTTARASGPDGVITSETSELVLQVAQPEEPAQETPATPVKPESPVKPGSTITVTGLPSTGTGAPASDARHWWIAATAVIALAGIGIGIRRRAT